MSHNEMTLAGFVMDLQRLMDTGKLAPDAKVWIGESYPYSNHRYLVGSWMTTVEEPEPEHTCDSIPLQDHDAETCDYEGCSFCQCPGCAAEDELPVRDLYLMMGDQSPLPDAELEDVDV